ncbi:hypothetical protein Taro_009761, partial [Colocasia esculenta]|nr:hypothetical protein [Colocasia esculenta]
MEKVESLTFFLQELLDRRIFRALCSSLKQGSSNSCETWSSSRVDTITDQVDTRPSSQNSQFEELGQEVDTLSEQVDTGHPSRSSSCQLPDNLVIFSKILIFFFNNLLFGNSRCLTLKLPGNNSINKLVSHAMCCSEIKAVARIELYAFVVRNDNTDEPYQG